jgi:hypothetical protein
MQTLVLWALLVQREGGGFQKDIRPEVKKPDREALVKAGLITAQKRGRGIWLEATDKGWSWATAHLDAELPKRSTAGSAILQAWLTRFKAFMARQNLVLADVLSVPKEPERLTEPALRLDYSALRERVRKAYFDSTGNKLNTRVLLKDLRQQLGDIDRTSLDEALGRMHLEEGTTLSGLNNPQEITPAVRDAALMFKGEPMYVMWITK